MAHFTARSLGTAAVAIGLGALVPLPAGAATHHRRSTVPHSALAVVDGLKSRGLPVSVSVTFTAADDPNHLLGRPGGYLSKTSFNDPRAGDPADGTPGSVDLGGSVELFASHSQAQARANYIRSVERAEPIIGTEYDYVDGGALLRLSSTLTPAEAKSYGVALKRVMSPPAHRASAHKRT